MSVNLITLIVLASFFLLMIFGLPVAFSLIGTAIIFTLIFWNPSALYIAPTTIFTQGTKEVFLAIPFFVFLAAVLERSGVAESLYDMFYKWVGRLGGGLATGCVLICTILDAISGLGATGIVTIGPIALPEMLKRRYDPKMAMGCIAAGSALGPLIPPSVIMIIIAGFTGLSVGKLFASGLFPGLLCSAGFIAYITIMCRVKPHMGPPISKEVQITWHEKLIALRSVILPVFLILSVMGTIYTGITTPTEGAAVGAFGALICAAINRKLTWNNLYQAGKTSLRITCMVMWLLIGGGLFAALLSAIGVQETISQGLAGIQAAYGSMGVLVIMMVVVFIMGMFIDGAAITVLTMPVFFPIVEKAGLDPLWFGALFTLNICMGYLTPPFGMNLFYMKGIVPPHIKMSEIYESIIPYVAIMVLVLIIVISFPEIAVWFPNKMMPDR
jgi:tripartite ATP-independent transporter DctM subunit